MRTRWLLMAVAMIALLAVAAACGDDDDDDGGGGATTAPAGGGEAADVDVTLVEFSVVADPGTAAAGMVNFHITNDGPEDQHEFVVIKTDLDSGGLPTDDTGAVDEEGEGIEVIDEVEEIDVAVSEDLSVDLEAGSYALICNIFDEDENESHYQEGMHTGFTVE